MLLALIEMGRESKCCGPVARCLIVIFFCCVAPLRCDKPCAPRPKSDSVECVCNATYCDEISRVPPTPGRFIAYTTTKSGLRFYKTTGPVEYNWYSGQCTSILDLDPGRQFQTIEGFGGAPSDSSADLWDKMDPQLKKRFIDSYFASNGIEYNMLRVPIGATDFSKKVYTYQDSPENDPTLSNFTLAPEDYQLKIPFIKAAMKTATAPIHTVATMWGPPLWMKTRHEVSGVSRVKKEYYEALAKYHYKFLEKYAAEGIRMWGLTTPNEPLSGIMSLGDNVRVTWTTKGLGEWVANHIGPMLRNSPFKDVKLIIGEDMRLAIGMWFNLVIMETPKVLDYIQGIGVHFYFDDFTPAEMLTKPLKGHEDIWTLYTESSVMMDGQTSWQKAKQFATNIIQDLSYNVTGFIDWNMCLYPDGGPSWSKIKLDSPVIVYQKEKQFAKQAMFYALGHFSKFLPRGSRRIATDEYLACDLAIENVSFLTPKRTIVTILHNGNNETLSVQIKLGYRSALVALPPESFTTVEFNYGY